MSKYFKHAENCNCNECSMKNKKSAETKNSSYTHKKEEKSHEQHRQNGYKK